MVIRNKNGIPLLGRDGMIQTKRGCNTGKCPPSVKTTPYPAKGATGVSLAKYRRNPSYVK
jgi:hypothetical protein